MNSMANWVMLHRLGYSCNLYTGIEDPIKDLERPCKSSGIALLFNLILIVNILEFILP